MALPTEFIAHRLNEVLAWNLQKDSCLKWVQLYCEQARRVYRYSQWGPGFLEWLEVVLNRVC